MFCLFCIDLIVFIITVIGRYYFGLDTNERIVSLVDEIGIAYYYCVIGGKFNNPTQKNSIKWNSIYIIKY